MCWASSQSATSEKFATARPPKLVISSATSLAARGSAPVPSHSLPRSLTTTEAPSCAISIALLRPRPLPAPVTMTTLPSSMAMSPPMFIPRPNVIVANSRATGMVVLAAVAAEPLLLRRQMRAALRSRALTQHADRYSTASYAATDVPVDRDPRGRGGDAVDRGGQPRRTPCPPDDPDD